MSATFKPASGDRVRVVYEGVVTNDGKSSGDVGFTLHDEVPVLYGDPGLISIEKIEPTPALPDGLTVSEDGSLLNWLGENYVRQHVTFQPGDTVRRKDLGLIYSIGEGGYYSHGKRKWFTHEHAGTSSDYFTSERFEKISLG